MSHARLRASAAALALAAAFLPAAAFGQTAPAAQPSTGPAEALPPAAADSGGAAGEIVVTGSRIPQPQLSGISPVTTVSQAEIRLQGATRTEDLINALPQAFGAQGSAVSNGASGTATVDLRGLGVTRTLVLVNGRRLLPGDPRSPVADVNAVPASLIKRVDVLTGGASSV
jgi:iron complex outermembrane recepter protein